MKQELKTQADRWKYLVNGGKLTDGFDILVIKNGVLWDESEDKYSRFNLSGDGWAPYIEPMQDEFETILNKEDDEAEKIVRKYIGKRVKIKIEEVV